MNRLVTIVDYGMGNLLSVAKALEHCGAEVRVSDRFEHIRDADLLVLPGVGAFANAMVQLQRLNLDLAIKEFALTERPFLGICLGMQLMFERSEEFGNHQGIGLLPGSVVAIERTDIHGNPHKIPHIGWAAIAPPVSHDYWPYSILQNTAENAAFYFVHSFTAEPTEDEHRLADTYYGGRRISAAVKSGNMYGCQFHPEKSGKEGLKIIKSFLTQ
jgi:imidazole glycerol-phosphate synthase subunit HisH